VPERIRSISRVVSAVRTLEGEGFVVRRSFPTSTLTDVDPFMLLDEMGPADLKPGEAKGAPDHPHRGFETVTYMLAGGLKHQDSTGREGRLGPGDVQWMTAGAGVVHSELPDEQILSKGGRMHGFQLWVNLPRRDKMMKPRYQEIPASQIPVAESPDKNVTARVIAGEAMGRRAVIETRTPILAVHYTAAPGARTLEPVPNDYNAFLYVFGGEASFAGRDGTVREGHAVLFATDGDHVAFEAAGQKPLEVLLMAGRPLHEPVARFGPFVMNTEQEVLQAFQDFREGRLGKIS
jgi:quercetin 2,3-dioxygenase